MQKPNLTEINPIVPRANAKLVTLNNRKFLIGGLTADKFTSDIYEMRTIQQDGILKVQWKLLKFKNNLFMGRNSFSACATDKFIYIWGGLESKVIEQICLNDLIEVDVDKGEMRHMPLKEKIAIHSTSLLYDDQENKLIAIGGTNELSTMQSFLYSLKLQIGQEKVYQWTKIRLDCEQHKGYLWQHTAHLSKKSYFTGQPGKFLTTIGGCHYPQSPYNSIVQFDLRQSKVSNKATIKFGLASHDSIAEADKIVIYGGANGGDFNNNKIIFKEGKVQYEKGHNAIGCASCSDQKGYYIIGGVSGPESLNGVVIYRKS